MDLFKKQKMKFILIATVSAAIIAFAALGIYFGVTYAAEEKFIDKVLEESLSAPNGNEQMPFNKQCILLRVEKDTIVFSEGLENYNTSISNNIKTQALRTTDGTFSISGYSFKVKSKTDNVSTLYAIYDYTEYHDNISSMLVRLSIIYCCIIVIVVILSYLSSSYMLKPVSDAMRKQKDLIANASHELKTPLTVITTNLDVVKSDPQSTIEENDKWIDSIDSQIKRMQGLITNMLELSKLEQSELPKQRLNFSEIVEGECLMFEPVCFEKGKELITNITPELYINGEKDSLQRLVTILIDNASKYSGTNGKIGITLSLAKKSVLLTIMNTGEVISSEDAKHVFDRFYRSDGARKNEDKQSFGLGLSIAAATVQSHGGTISCQGIENKGTAFIVSIPYAKELKEKKNKKK